MSVLVAHLAALCTIIIWGITFISTKILLQDFNPQTILFMRFVLGWICLWLICPRVMPFLGAKTEFLLACAGFFGVTIYFLLENIALDYSLAANVGVIVSTAPFFTALVDWLFFGGTRPGFQFYAGFVLAMLGIGLISFHDTALAVNPVGDVLALLAALAWAFYSNFIKKLSVLNQGSLKITRRAFFYGLLFMLPILPFYWTESVYLKICVGVNLFNLLFLGVGASALCFVIWTFCLNRLGTEKASAYIYLVPVVTVIAAALLLRETLSQDIIIGMLLVVLGLALSELRLKRKANLKA